jgi:hypothetical protein
LATRERRRKVDLGRWGERKIQQISTRSRSLYEFLADWLEGERALASGAAALAGAAALGRDIGAAQHESGAGFASRDEGEALERDIIAAQASLGVEDLFEAFIPYFECGFFLRREALARAAGPSDPPAEKWLLERLFIFGRAFAPEEDRHPSPQRDFPHAAKPGFQASAPSAEDAPAFPVPPMARWQVLETRPRPVLRLFGLDSVARLRDSSAFMLKPTDDVAFLVLSCRGRPWLLARLEAARRAVALWAAQASPLR